MSQPAMNESEARRGWSYICKLALSAFAILLCLVTSKFFVEHRLAPKNFGLGGVLSQPRLDLLLIGSSHTRKSYDMHLLERRTGVTESFQISYDSTDLSAASQMLDYLVARPDHCPRYLVIEAYSALLARRPDLQDPRYFSDAPPPLKVAIIRSYLSQRSFPSSFLDIFDLVVNRGNDEIVTGPFYSPIVERGSYKGGRNDLYFSGLSADAFSRLNVSMNGHTPNADQLSALYHIIDLAHSHNIAVMFIDTPMPQPVSSNPDIQLLKKDFREILGARHVPYIDGDYGFPINDPTMFSDSNHLSSRGREEFTSRISVQLESWMASQPAAGY
jgi:hypothetical protein